MAQSPQEQKAIVQRMIDAGESEENIATVIQHFKNSAPPQDNRPGWLKFIAPDGPVAQTGRGLSQSVMSSLIPLADMALSATPAKGFVPRQAVQALTESTATPHTPIERGAKVVGDVGQFAAPFLAGAKAMKPAQWVAGGIERMATGMGKKEAQWALEHGVAKATRANANKVFRQALAEEAAQTSPTGVVKTPPVVPSELRQVSWPLRQAARVSHTPMADAATLLASAPAWAYGPKYGIPATALAIGKTLATPARVTGTAQAVYNAAPYLNPGGAGASALVAGYLKSLFGGGSE